VHDSQRRRAAPCRSVSESTDLLDVTSTNLDTDVCGIAVVVHLGLAIGAVVVGPAVILLGTLKNRLELSLPASRAKPRGVFVSWVGVIRHVDMNAFRDGEKMMMRIFLGPSAGGGCLLL
jgi:hypothetical protein